MPGAEAGWQHAGLDAVTHFLRGDTIPSRIVMKLLVVLAALSILVSSAIDAKLADCFGSPLTS